MKAPTRPGSLMMRRDIRRELDCSRGWVNRVTARADFPAPQDVIDDGPVWPAGKVRAWIKRNPPARRAGIGEVKKLP